MLMPSNANANLGQKILWDPKELKGKKIWQEASEEKVITRAAAAYGRQLKISGN